MHTSHRVIRIALVGALLLGLLLSSPSSAVSRGYTTYHDAGGRPFLTIGMYGGRAHFNIQYQVVQTRDAGQTWWSLTRVETNGVAQNGQNCLNSDYCAGFHMSTKVQFLNAAGSVLLTANLPSGACYAIVHNAADAVIRKCSVPGYQVSVNATRIKFTFNLYVVRHDGWTFGWPTVTKTVPIV